MSDHAETHPSDHDRINRRNFVGLGAVALGAAPLTEFLSATAQAAPQNSIAVIHVYLAGGPSQLDTFDPKPNAPAAYRGPFAAIPTNVPGIQLSEMFPLLSRQMNRFSIVRSVSNRLDQAGPAQHLMFTGYRPTTAPPTDNDRPAIGSVIAALKGAGAAGVPAYVCIPRIPPFAEGAYLGLAAQPFELTAPGPQWPGLRSIRPHISLDQERLAGLAQHKITLKGAQLAGKSGLGQAALGRLSQSAAQLAASPAIQKALAVEQEPAKLRARYGLTQLGQRLLLARRLVEAGVTSIVVEDTGWAMSSQIEAQMSQKGPVLDRAVTALVDDLSQRGLFRNVLVVVWGEFGRSARLNSAAGRDNSGNVFSVLLAGGGLRAGIVVGSSDARGEFPQDAPVGPEDILATIYSVLGIDPQQTFKDPTGQPVAVLPQGKAIKALT